MVTVFFVMVWGEQYREDLVQNGTVFVVMVWREQNREELLLNVAMLVWSGDSSTEKNCY